MIILIKQTKRLKQFEKRNLGVQEMEDIAFVKITGGIRLPYVTFMRQR